VRFWRNGPRGTFRALLGVDVARPVGESALVLQDGDAAPCRVGLEVAEAGFGTRELRVARRFVDLRPSDQRRAGEEAARLEAIFAAASPERLWRGPFDLPLRGIEPTPNFGQRRILNGEARSQHSGVDFRARTGTPVRAAQRGRVALAEPLFWSGRTVILDHGLGLFTVYGHLSAIDVRVGRLVPGGTRLGRVGATGRVTGPHLHWSVRLDGARVDPMELVGLEERGP
jgi:murein DD-endopeptidase MepM/ murein hydrolase activator NlpD